MTVPVPSAVPTGEAEWPEACQSMLDMTGWRQVTCEERDHFYIDHYHDLTPFSALTDPDGVYSSGVVYTEWGVKDGEVPWIRDYRYSKDADCIHFMPEASHV